LFHAQKNSNKRTWHIVDEKHKKMVGNDHDSLEYKTASNKTFVELLPDTFVSHDDELILGVDFSNEPGLSVLEYKVRFQTPGSYYVWVRAFVTGTENNGIGFAFDKFVLATKYAKPAN
jgi:hypothetical protein